MFIDHVVEAVASGRLDEVLGNYGFVRDLSFVADEVISRGSVEAHPDELRHWNTVLLGCLAEFVAKHPFGFEAEPPDG